MRTTFSFIICLLLLASCKPHEQVNGDQRVSVTVPAYNYPKLQGSYRGDFGGSDISLVLRYVSGRHAVGYNIHKGLRRNISGDMGPSGIGFQFTLSEPGDNPYDGVFSLSLDTSTMQIRGTWKPSRQGNLKEKSFVLKRDLRDTIAASGYYNVYSDSIGNFDFRQDGLCVYQFYPKGEGQMIEVKGNWSEQGKSYIIDWEPNEVFPARRSIYRQEPMEGGAMDGQEPEYFQLVGDNRTLYPSMF